MDTTPDPTPLAHHRPVVRTQSDLLQLWRGLMGELGFARSSTWVLHLDEDERPTRRLLEIDDCAGEPVADDLDSLTTMLLRVAGTPPGRWVFLRSRPGSHGPDRTDRAWARGLAQACRRAGVVTDVVHLATDQRLVPLPADNLVADDVMGDDVMGDDLPTSA
ncbi:hypothetical protein BKA08_000496 [Nocardioides marinisabuli]|uniref:Uncharacterized protein n=1 Tax=Nocardioides marinisabuli TaxID=419476 RepID=A0A7Y9JQ44_9ACTN|nr:hypothetical protein [Nocardioides marinisabuli]NYD56258.1 hypothetical protein [Nocardioides marinisabuli]